MVADIEGVRLAEMECMHCYAFCVSQRAKGFPTLTVYKNGELVKHDYYEDLSPEGFFNCAMAYHIGGQRKIDS